jgi:hypothetical protein
MDEEKKNQHPTTRIGLYKLPGGMWVTIGYDEVEKRIVLIPDMPCNPYENYPS